METTFGRTVETRATALTSPVQSRADIKDLHNDTFNNFFKNSSKYPFSTSEINSMSNKSYLARNNQKYLARNSPMNLPNERYKPLNQHELLMSTLEKNYELNKQIRRKFSEQLNNFTLPRKEQESIFPIKYNQNDKQSYSTLLPRKKYASGGYSSDGEFDQPIMQHSYRKFSTENRSKFKENTDLDKMQILANRSNRYKSLDRQDIDPKTKNFAYYSAESTNRPRFSSNTYLDYDSPRKFVLNTEDKTTQLKNSQENLIKNINEYFLKWKTFNYDPVNTSNCNLANNQHQEDMNQSQIATFPNNKTNNSMNPAKNNIHLNTHMNEPETISTSLSRRSRVSECFTINNELTPPIPFERNRSVDLEMFPSYLDRLNETNTTRNSRKSLIDTKTNLDSDPGNQVEEIVPLENALLNMNEILKHLTSNAEKKKTIEYNLMQTVINDFEALRKMNPEPLSTSLSITPSDQLSFSSPNPNSISPSASSSSSSYTNYSKTSSSVASTSSNSTVPNTVPNDVNCKLISRESRAASKTMSLSKKLKRFLSLNTVRRQEMNKE